MPKTVTINGEEYEIIPKASSAASRIISDFWVKLGQPPTPFTKNGQKLVDIMIAVWEDLYPVDAKIWYEERKEYQHNELSISQQVQRQTGRSLASYPMPLYQMLKKVFPEVDFGKRDVCIKFVKHWPQFRFANKV